MRGVPCRAYLTGRIAPRGMIGEVVWPFAISSLSAEAIQRISESLGLIQRNFIQAGMQNSEPRLLKISPTLNQGVYSV